MGEFEYRLLTDIRELFKLLVHYSTCLSFQYFLLINCWVEPDLSKSTNKYSALNYEIKKTVPRRVVIKHVLNHIYSDTKS